MGALLVLVAMLSSLICWADLPAEAPPFDQAELATTEARDRALALVQQGEVDAARALLEERLTTHPHDQQSRLLLADVLVHHGEPEAADATLRAGLTGEDTDLELHRYLAGLARQRAEDGPFVSRADGMMTAFPSDDSVDEDAWVQEQRRRAAEAMRAAVGIRPDEPSYAASLTEILLEDKKFEEALGILSELVRANPGQHHLWMQLADAHRQADDAGKAQEAYERVLEQDPKHTQAWLGLSELAMTAGLADEAHDHYRRAAYYGYMEPFDTPLYNEDRYELARLLSDARDEDTAQEVWDARRTEAIEGLITASNDWALLMLAALCWHHWDHGPVEDSAYEAMVQAGEPAVPLLTILAEKAGSKCTIGSACEALARLKAPGTLALLEHYGPQDSDLFFPMDIAQSMAELGDPDAIPALMALAGIGAPAPRPSGINALLGGTGLGDARNRAVLALGSFDHPDAHSALEQALEIPELALCAHAVLAGLSRGKAHRKALFTAHEQEPSYDTARAMRHLADRGNSRAAKLIEAWDEAQSEE